MPSSGSGAWRAFREVSPGTPDSFLRLARPPGPLRRRGLRAGGEARICPHRVPGELRLLNFSEPRAPPLQTGHPNASLCGFLEGFKRPGSWPSQGRLDTALVLWPVLSRLVVSLRPLRRAPPWTAQRRCREGRRHRHPWRVPGALEGVGPAHRPVQWVPPLPSSSVGSPGEGRFGAAERRCCGHRHQGAACGQKRRRQSLRSVGDPNPSVLSCEKSPDIQPSGRRWENEIQPGLGAG